MSKRKAGAYIVSDIPVKRAKFVQGRAAAYMNKRRGGTRLLAKPTGQEKKFYDTSLSQSALGVTITAGEHNPSATISLNTVTQGTGESQRDGRQITMDSISVKGAIEVPVQIDQTAMLLNTYCYIALVLDMQTNGALLNSEDVFDNQGGINSLVANPFRDLQFIQRFKVLAHKRIKLPQQNTQHDGTNIEVGGLVVPFDLYAKLKGIKTNYTASTETILNITDNGLNIIAYCGSLATAPVLSYKARLRFFG